MAVKLLVVLPPILRPIYPFSFLFSFLQIGVERAGEALRSWSAARHDFSSCHGERGGHCVGTYAFFYLAYRIHGL